MLITLSSKYQRQGLCELTGSCDATQWLYGDYDPLIGSQTNNTSIDAATKIAHYNENIGHPVGSKTENRKDSLAQTN